MSLPIIEQWRAIIDKDLRSPKGFGYVLEHMPIRLKGGRPGSGAETELCQALEIAFAYPDHPMVQGFARRAFDLATRGLKETEGLDVFAAGCEDDRFSSRRCRSYAASMLGLADLDRGLLKGAAEDLLLFMHGAMEESGWDVAAQSECLEAAALYLLAGEVGRAQELLSDRRGFKPLKIWQLGLLELAAALGGDRGGRPLRISDLPRFEKLFQDLRPWDEPAWMAENSVMSHHFLRLEICLLRYLYVTHPNEPIVWRTVFGQVGDDGV